MIYDYLNFKLAAYSGIRILPKIMVYYSVYQNLHFYLLKYSKRYFASKYYFKNIYYRSKM